MTETTWPAPRSPRGSRIVHSWRCTRSGIVVETVKRVATGQALTVFKCAECDGTDAAHRLRHPEPGGDAA